LIFLLYPVFLPFYLYPTSLSIGLDTVDEDKAFTTAKDAVSIQIFKIQSNVQGIQRLVDKLGGVGDGPALRTSL
jgi:syntaxin 7